jgi:hypothetical protein
VAGVSDDLTDLVDQVHDRVEHVSTAIKIIDFIWTHWWVILLCVAVLVFWPRRRNS